MIHIIITHKHHMIQEMKISGHAQAADKGEDLVCAAITGIVSGALNAFDLQCPHDVVLQASNNQVLIRALNLNNNDLQIMLLMLKNQLSTIWIQYKTNIEIKEVH